MSRSRWQNCCTGVIRSRRNSGVRHSIVGNTPRECGDFIRAELTKWGKVAKSNKI